VHERLRPLLSLALWLPLGGWLGALLLFGGVVAPAAFRTLPSRELAGDLVGAVAPWLQGYGIAAGLWLAILGQRLGRGRLAILIPCILAAFCACSQGVLAPRIHALRPRLREATVTPELRARFAGLHAASVGLYGLTTAGVAVLAVLHAREDAKKIAGIP
jgi:hypothetical protein